MDIPSPLDPMDPNVIRHSPSKARIIEKPLTSPPDPIECTPVETAAPILPTNNSLSPSRSNRPPLAGQPSFQRPRKRVIWRNKTCFIALPLENESGRTTTRVDYLKPQEVTRRLEIWEEKGFDTTGFVLAPSSINHGSVHSQGQSRSVHPDSDTQDVGRSSHSYRVGIPDRQEWEAYVCRLREEKLRALGVTGDGEPQSRRSPAPSLMSRQASSQSSAILTSPPLHPTAVASHPFGPAYQLGPGQSNKAGVSHFPRYSVAMPFLDRTISPAGQHPLPLSPTHRNVSPLGYMSSQTSSRIASPSLNEQLLNIQQSTLPAAPSQVRNGASQGAANVPYDPTPRLQRQQSPAETPHLGLRYYPSLSRSTSSEDVSRHNNSTIAPANAPNDSGIVIPAPRIHRQNPSESLQREVEEAEAYLEKMEGPENSLSGSDVDGDESDSSPRKIESKNPADEKGPESPDATPSSGDTKKDTSRHRSKSSLSSKLNVNAPEFKFEPKSSIPPDVFAFLPSHQKTRTGPAPPTQPTSIGPHARKVSYARPLPKLNAAAPTFTPENALTKPSVPSRVFSFGNENVPNVGLNATVNENSQEFNFSSKTPSFNPDAPAFTPSDPSVIDHAKSDATKPVVGRIFSDVRYVDAVKPAKESKALPIVNPRVGAGNDGESEGQEDESGRITQSDARQKRTRLVQDGGDQVPQFANPADDSWSSVQADAYLPPTSLPSVNHRRRATSLEAATNMLEEIFDDMSASESSSIIADGEPRRLKYDGGPFPDQKFDNDVSVRSKRFLEQATNPRNDAATMNLSNTKRDVHKVGHPSISDASRELEERSPTSPTSSASSTYSEIREDGNPGVRKKAFNMPPIRQDVLDGMRHVEPSYQEIDTVIKHLNQDGDSDIGVEREPSPWKHSNSLLERGRSPRKVLQETVARQLLPPANIRSDAPSPSPNRLREPFQYLPPTDTESQNSAVARVIEENARYSPSYRPSKNPPSVDRLNASSGSPPSDWDDGFSSVDETLLRSKTAFFDRKVNDVVGNIMQERLQPLEKTLSTMQESLVCLSKQSTSRITSGRPRSSGTLDVVNSDADDEDETQDLNLSRIRSPLRDRKYDQLKSSIGEIALAQQNSVSTAQLGELLSSMKELKSSIMSESRAPNPPTDMKAIVEDAINRHLRGKSAPVISSSQAAAAEKSQLQITGLESMLKIAENRAEDEMKARRATEDALADNQRLLRQALHEASQQRESVEATEAKLQEFHEERQHHLRHTALLEGSQEGLEKTASDFAEKNEALESTLDEYRVSHGQWRTNIDDLKHENREVQRTVHSLEHELQEINKSRELLRVQLMQIRDQLALSSTDVAADQYRWRNQAQQHKDRLDLLNARLEAEARTRERLELEIERLELQEKDAMKARFQAEQTHKANNHLDKLVGQLRSEVHEHQNTVTRLQRENHAAKETGIMEVHRVRSTADADIKSAKRDIQAVQNELQATIDRLESQRKAAVQDASKTRYSYEDMLQKTSASNQAALQEATATRESALNDQKRFHEHAFEQLKAEHQRAVENALEDKQRSEAHFGEMLEVAKGNSTQLHDKIVNLEEKLEIAKSAAHAAVQAAQANKTTNGPSAPQRSPDSRSNIPEKISPQALRESIMVLQEQLQARESTIEELESKVAAIDAKAPDKLREAEMEITWLRELLSVRIDDLQDIVQTLSQPSFNTETVRDAAIRLKTNLQMEQQEKERSVAGGQSLSSIANITNLATTPRAFPMAAAAAWSNWRKRRDSNYENNSTLAHSRLNQTPSKVSSSSPHSNFSGLLTPPNTNMRTALHLQGTGSRPVSASGHFLRRPSTPIQSTCLNGEQSQDPKTPPLMRKASYDLDAAEAAIFGEEHEVEQPQLNYNESDSEVTAQEAPFGPRLMTSAG